MGSNLLSGREANGWPCVASLLNYVLYKRGGQKVDWDLLVVSGLFVMAQQGVVSQGIFIQGVDAYMGHFL